MQQEHYQQLANSHPNWDLKHIFADEGISGTSLKNRDEFNDMIKRFDCDSRIIKEFTTEKDAFDCEYERIKQLKAIGQCVCNIYDGGCGGVTTWWTEERKQWYSEHNVMKSQSQRERMSAKNPMKNIEVANIVAKKNRKPVIINGKRYEGVTFAAKELKVTDQTIVNWCRQGYDGLGNPCRYEGEEQKESLKYAAIYNVWQNAFLNMINNKKTL